MIIPIKFLIALQRKIIENNEIQLLCEEDKKKKQDLKLVNLVFNSNINYLIKYCKKEKLEDIEINIDDNIAKDILGIAKECDSNE